MHYLSRHLSPPLLPAAALAAALTAGSPAHATLVAASFSGVVQSQTASGLAVGAAVNGSFTWDTATSSFTAFTVAGQAPAAGYASSAATTPDGYTALYKAQLSPVSGGASNSSFTVDLEALAAPWSGDAASLLLSGQLAANLDTSASTFGYYTANADGTGIRQLTAQLQTISAVPEPAPALMLGCGLAALAWRRRRRA